MFTTDMAVQMTTVALDGRMTSRGSINMAKTQYYLVPGTVLTERFSSVMSSLSEVPYLLHADASSFFSAQQGAEKLIADHIVLQLHLMNYLYAQLLFCSYFTRWCKL